MSPAGPDRASRKGTNFNVQPPPRVGCGGLQSAELLTRRPAAVPSTSSSHDLPIWEFVSRHPSSPRIRCPTNDKRRQLWPWSHALPRTVVKRKETKTRRSHESAMPPRPSSRPFHPTTEKSQNPVMCTSTLRWVSARINSVSFILSALSNSASFSADFDQAPPSELGHRRIRRSDVPAPTALSESNARCHTPPSMMIPTMVRTITHRQTRFQRVHPQKHVRVPVVALHPSPLVGGGRTVVGLRVRWTPLPSRTRAPRQRL